MAKHVPPPPPPPPSEPIEVKLRDALEERYLAYALSTIMGRALPDARDGLKPVHRRILYGMHILRLDPGSAFKKCAKIVGDVMGSFHPHGDQAIYEALVRLAQDFVSRYPLIEGQGNFGNIDGDNAAAYRYTEARMTDVARLIMEGVEEDSVDWRDNYSGDAKEPIVMPSAVPEPARQWRAGHRGRHGDVDSAAQHRRALRRRALSHRPSRGRRRSARHFRAGSGFPDRRRRHRRQVRDHRNLPDRPRRLSGASALGEGGYRPRRLGRGRHANSLRRPEVPADRADRQSSQRAQNSAARRRPRRIDRGRAHRARAAHPRGRARNADGIPVQADRARGAGLGQHERAGRRRDAQGRLARRGAQAMARPSPQRSGAPLASPIGGDRQAARTARRHDHRLSQSRRGHPHRSRGR